MNRRRCFSAIKEGWRFSAEFCNRRCRCMQSQQRTKRHRASPSNPTAVADQSNSSRSRHDTRPRVVLTPHSVLSLFTLCVCPAPLSGLVRAACLSPPRSRRPPAPCPLRSAPRRAGPQSVATRHGDSPTRRERAGTSQPVLLPCRPSIRRARRAGAQLDSLQLRVTCCIAGSVRAARHAGRAPVKKKTATPRTDR